MSKPIIECIYHPKYTGTREPRAKCIICWKIYAANLYNRLKEERSKNAKR